MRNSKSHIFNKLTKLNADILYPKWDEIPF